MNPLKTIKYQLYLFQLENYDLRRFLALIGKTFGHPKFPPRKELVWTAKAKALFLTALVLQALVAAFLADGLIALVVFGLLSYIHFLFLAAATMLLRPPDFVLKSIIIARAKRKLKKFQNLKIIGITGSYGKTTMKEVLAAVLEVKFKVLKTPDSVNTEVGIGRLILKELTAQTEIFIVEMGAYRRGDIKTLCELARPDIAILTGINEAHLERFGSIENTVGAKFEIVENSAPDALVVLNRDDERVRENYKKFVGGHKVLFYSKNNAPLPPLILRGGEGELLLGDYAKGMINAACSIARELEMTDAEILKGFSQIKPIPHRLEPIENPNGILVIDDSYNGNPDGVREAIKVLSQFKDKRKIFLTPGLVEMGERSPEIHTEIGRQLSKAADIVILIKNSVTPFIEEGVLSVSSSGERSETRESSLDSRLRGNDKPQIIWFDNTSSAHEALAKLLKPGDVILFQNDWPDNYL